MGQFLIESIAGNKYIMVIYNYNSNAILAKTFPNQKATTIATTFQELHQQLCKAGHPPKAH